MSKAARHSRPDKRPGLVRIPWAVILLSASFALAALGIIWGLRSTATQPRETSADWSLRKHDHKPKNIMSSQVRHFSSLIDFHRLWNVFLGPMLIERYPGSEGIVFVRQHIKGQLESLSAHWTLELDTFEDKTPLGRRSFSNLVATLDPSAQRRLVLACHYDSKYFPPNDRGRVYVGATDSAVPCSMILELVHSLDKELVKLKERGQDLTLQLLFLDGEEALVSWSPADSLYGSRHLAERMARTKHPAGDSSTTLIDSVDLFMLLDLLGGSKPTFLNHFRNTAHWFNRLLGIGVPILHLIATPFPWVWHTMEDTAENLHPPTIENLCKILSVFVVEYLGL
ncbi:glutaminyl-peptide cyclotransferase-like isoform X2 [Narcine bancroftii]|uniref:glutaminyl-peptide cyclotransferase-like isoform X2 n=1 Tax=Narcine bancroftii TaxID=1343680 RepID=UPI00383189C4